jgi:hypothetical protein
VTSGANTASFDLNTIVVDQQTSTNLDLSGTGVMHLTGFEATYGNWKFTTNSFQTDGTFGFVSTNKASGRAVPDGGSTALMLGAALAGAGFFAKRRKA